MATDSGTKELDEALDAGFGLAVSLKNALSDGRVTTDEILESVTDGQVRASVRNLTSAVEAIVHGGSIDIANLAGVVIDAVTDFLGNLKSALADGRVSLDELLHTVVDGNIKEQLRVAVEGAEKIPEELSDLDFKKIMALFQKISKWIPELVTGK